jgi:hypothetical protein
VVVGVAPHHRRDHLLLPLVHVLDTALVRVSPEAYNEVIETYKTPIVGLMESAWSRVLFHALNGMRDHPGRLLVARVTSADAGASRHLAAGHGAGVGRRRHPHGGAFPVTAILDPASPRGRIAPVMEKESTAGRLDHRARRAGRGIPTSRSTPGCSCASPVSPWCSWCSATCSSC